jgi:hypothetical protein
MYIIHVTKTEFTLSLIPLSTIPKANSTTAAYNNTELYNSVHIDVVLRVPYMFYHLPYIPNREKYNKLCSVCQVMLPFKGGSGVLSVSVRYLVAGSKS